MFDRNIEKELREALGSYPVVTVVGPRQSGKTTLIKKVLTDKPYFNLEKPDTRALIIEDPVGILKDNPQGAIFDEAQHVPELASYIQHIVDEKNENGLYVLSGSHQPELQASVTQSLAGRTAILHLLPLSLSELKQSNVSFSLEEQLLTGFLPKIYADDLDPTKYYSNYMQTYLEKDVRQLINLKDLHAFQRFLKLCAARVGQMLNMNAMSNDLGISHNTAKHWLSIMQASHVITLLPPYFENFGKRVIKSPKLYFFDVGLASFLLDLDSVDQIKRDVIKGNLLENLVVMELYKARYNQGRLPDLYYYRDSQQLEVDIVFKRGSNFVGVEIKSGQTIKKSMYRNLESFKKLVGDRFDEGFLIYAGEDALTYKDISVLHYQHAYEIFE